MVTAAEASPPKTFAGSCDRSLETLLHAAGEDARRTEIEHLLLTVARPLSERILSRQLRGAPTLRRDDADDIMSTVMLRLVSRLAAVGSSKVAAIDDFRSYVASLTYNTVYSFLREQVPQRTRLKNRLRYVLTHDDRLALWPSRNDFVCGLRGWNGAPASSWVPPFSRRSATPSMVDQRKPAQAVVAILKAIGQPVALDALSDLIVELWGIRDGPPALKTEVTPDPQPSALLAMERREFVTSLWKEIQSLRCLQRKALLLNLRHGETVNVLGLFVAIGITTVAEVAAVLEMSKEDFVNIWSELPLSDARIA